MMKHPELLQRLLEGNRRYVADYHTRGDVSPAVRVETAEHGQHPYAIVIACSDSREIPEAIFAAGIGELFVIRVAGNVIGDTQLASVEYAAGHLGSRLVVVLGHTHCGAVAATLEGGGEGHIKILTDEIACAIGRERDPDRAGRMNVRYAVQKLRAAYADDANAPDIVGALYDISTGCVTVLDDKSE